MWSDTLHRAKIDKTLRNRLGASGEVTPDFSGEYRIPRLVRRSILQHDPILANTLQITRHMHSSRDSADSASNSESEMCNIQSHSSFTDQSNTSLRDLTIEDEELEEIPEEKEEVPSNTEQEEKEKNKAITLAVMAIGLAQPIERKSSDPRVIESNGK